MSDAEFVPDGYSVPEPSPGQGAPEPEAPPASVEPAPQQPDTQPQPEPGTPRFNEVYRNWKEQERVNAELKTQLEAQLMAQPPQYEEQQYEQAPAPSNEEDPWGELRTVIGEAVEQRIAPIQQQLQAEKQQSQIQANYAAFQAKNPEFDANVHGPKCLQIVRSYRERGVDMPVDAAYAIAFPDIAAQKMAPPQTAPQAPVADVGGQSVAAPPAESPAALWDQVQKEQNPARREELYNQFIMAGGAGAVESEAKLGW